MKSDGTVEVVAGSSTSVAESIPAGSEVVFNSGASNYISSSFDTNNANKFVIVYQDGGNSSYGRAIVGTVSGTSITFGSEYVFNSAVTYYTSVAFDPNTAGKFVVSYRDSANSNYGTAIVGTVSGTSISFGSAVVFNSGNSHFNSISFDPNTAGKFVVAYSDSSNSWYGTAVVGTVSGTSISFGSEYVFNSTLSYELSMSFDPNTAGKFVVAYRSVSGSTGTCKAIVGTVSGTSLSYGSATTFNSDHAYYISASFDPNTAGKFVVAYRDAGNSNYGTAIVGTVSGTSISFGSEYVFNSSPTMYASVSFDPNTTGKFVVTYGDDGNSNYGTAIVGTVSGTSISFGSEYVFNSGTTYYSSIFFDPNTAGKFVVAFRDAGNSSYGTAIVGQIAATVTTTNLTTANFAGTATAAFTNGQTATIVPQGGVSTNQSSLTIGSTYYVQKDATLATTADSFVTVVAGKAISATSLILKGNS